MHEVKNVARSKSRLGRTKSLFFIRSPFFLPSINPVSQVLRWYLWRHESQWVRSSLSHSTYGMLWAREKKLCIITHPGWLLDEGGRRSSHKEDIEKEKNNNLCAFIYGVDASVPRPHSIFLRQSEREREKDYRTTFAHNKWRRETIINNQLFRPNERTLSSWRTSIN